MLVVDDFGERVHPLAQRVHQQIAHWGRNKRNQYPRSHSRDKRNDIPKSSGISSSAIWSMSSSK